MLKVLGARTGGGNFRAFYSATRYGMGHEIHLHCSGFGRIIVTPQHRQPPTQSNLILEHVLVQPSASQKALHCFPITFRTVRIPLWIPLRLRNLEDETRRNMTSFLWPECDLSCLGRER